MLDKNRKPDIIDSEFTNYLVSAHTEPKQLSKRARMRAAGKIREGLIKRREAHSDLLVSGFQRRADREPDNEEFGGGPAHVGQACRSVCAMALARTHSPA